MKHDSHKNNIQRVVSKDLEPQSIQWSFIFPLFHGHSIGHSGEKTVEHWKKPIQMSTQCEKLGSPFKCPWTGGFLKWATPRSSMFMGFSLINQPFAGPWLWKPRNVGPPPCHHSCPRDPVLSHCPSHTSRERRATATMDSTARRLPQAVTVKVTWHQILMIQWWVNKAYQMWVVAKNGWMMLMMVFKMVYNRDSWFNNGNGSRMVSRTTRCNSG